MRDANGLLPLVLVALLLGGVAYLPRSAAQGPPGGTGEKPGVSGADTSPSTRTEIELVGDYFAVDVERLAYLRAVACAQKVVKKANPVQLESVNRLMTAAGVTARADLSTRVAIELKLAGDGAPTCGRPPDEVLRDYLGDKQEHVQLELLHERIHDRAKIDFVVAIVPDPVDSNGRWQFDPLVDALQRAVAESGYVLDRFTLPDSDSGVNPNRRAALTRHEREPGAILFRHTRTNPMEREQLLLVFLVYETATGGAHQEALDHAIATTADWQQMQRMTGPVRVLGPTYSGSIPSIQRVLKVQVARKSAMHVRVVSGAATAFDNQAMITSVAPGRVSYHATVLPDQATLATLVQHIDTTPTPSLGGRSRTAVLVEGNTAWGRQAGDVLRDAVVFPFPLHISRLRSVTARERLADPAAVRAPSRFLPLTLDDPITPADQIPSFSPRTTATSVELVGANLLTTIRREGIEKVGILATDTRDKLFLAQLITQFSPDVTVFTTEPDLLFTHPDYRRYTRGLLVGSTYPLFNALQPATMGEARRLQFGSMAAQGVYNALLALLNYDEQGVARADDAPELVDYGIPNERSQSKPPLWIGVVGTDAIWPVRYVPVDDGGILHPYQRPRSSKPLSPWRPRLSPWTMGLLACVALAALYHVLVVIYQPRPSSRRAPGHSREPFVFAFHHHAHGGAGFEARSPYLAACMVSLLPLVLLGALLSGGAIAPDRATYAESWGWLWVVEFGWILLALGLLYGCLNAMRAYMCTVTARSYGLIAVAILLVISMLGGTFIVDVLDTQKLAAFVQRAGQPFNGVSPVVPLVLLTAGLYLWASAQLLRVSHRPKADAFSRPDAAPYNQLGSRQFDERLGEVTSIMSEPLGNMKPRFVALAGAAALVPAVLAIVRGISTVEHHTLGAYFLLSWVLTQGIVALWVAHAYDLWIGVRKLLRALSGDATAPAFDRMRPAFFSNRFAIVLPGPQTIRRISAEAALLERGVDDDELAIAQIRGALRPGASPQMPDTIVGGPIAGHIESIARARDWSTLVTSGAALHGALLKVWPVAHERAELQRAMGKSPDVHDMWLERAETLAMMPVAVLIRELVAMVTQTLFLATGGVLLMVAFLASMPMHSRQTLVGIAWFDVFALSATALAIFVQADRDELLSRMTATPAGKVTWDVAFVSKVALYAGIPLLTLFVSQFPELTDSLGRWLQSLRSQLP